ncbi:MAG: hypothetical protein B2I17_07300 [Thermoplasmatales archaeon B_DKE]|nr:MAG: hypothetical protein B2I17_07300 [Thermoplasmatales archaeon B_DKE]
MLQSGKTYVVSNELRKTVNEMRFVKEFSSRVMKIRRQKQQFQGKASSAGKKLGQKRNNLYAYTLL